MGSTAERLFSEAFETEVLEQAEDHSDLGAWSAAGRNKRKSNPQGEDGVWWREHGPGMVQNWMDWRSKSQWQVWTTPDLEPAIELGIEVETEAGIAVKMFIDRVFISKPTNQLVILDLKTGSRTPESDLQLAFYRYGIFKRYGIDVRFGCYWMARDGKPKPPR